MPAIMKISPQGQIRLPKKVMTTLGIETGDYVEVDIEDRQVVLKPRKLIDPSQAWYWTREWQKMESDSDADFEKGRLSPEFTSAEEGLRWLKA
jgi:AbrB family looped-hinge helix DNA binding protein